MITVHSEVSVLEVDTGDTSSWPERPLLHVCSHGIADKSVVLHFSHEDLPLSKEFAVNGYELIEAIKNALNTKRY